MAGRLQQWWCPAVVVLILSGSAGGWYTYYRHVTSFEAFDPAALGELRLKPVRWKGEVVDGGRIRVHEGDGRTYLAEPTPAPEVPLAARTEVYFEGVLAGEYADDGAGTLRNHYLRVEDFRVRYVRRLPEPRPDPPLAVRVVGQKFQWSFVYPDGSARSELHLPADGPVEFTVTSTDVIHCPEAPGLALPSAVPGHEATAHADGHRVPGTYELRCEEYCGGGHSRMKAAVVVESRAAFEAWLRGPAR